MKDIKPFLTNLPHFPGVYQMLNHEGIVLYVGKAKDLKKRITSYFSHRAKDRKTESLIPQIHHIDFTITRNESEAVLLECNLIKKHRPRYNVLLRDDKSYPYILMTTQHPFPRIDFMRGKKEKGNTFFGPYPSAFAVHDTIALIQKIFLLRTCRDSYFDARTRPCLLYQINRCSAPCVDFISETDYQHQVELTKLFLSGKNSLVVDMLQKEMQQASDSQNYENAARYRNQIARLRQIQDKQYASVGEGEVDVVGFSLEGGLCCMQLLTVRDGDIQGSRSYFPRIPNMASSHEILTAFVKQHYLHDKTHIQRLPKVIILPEKIEEQDLLENVFSTLSQHKVNIIVPIRGNKEKWLQMAMVSAKHALTARLHQDVNMKERLMALKEALHLKNVPTRIECFDVSHVMGEATVASCIVFNQQGPLKQDYRRYHIDNIQPGDDIAALIQALTRRFKRSTIDAPRPDLLMIDGGKGQLAAAEKVLAEKEITNIDVIGISKGPGRKPGFESIHRKDQGPVHFPKDSLALHFMQHIRDEAHRFAIIGHRSKRDKAKRQSPLENIPGIGAKKRRDLLRYFGGIQGISRASLEELMKVPGIHRSLAERVFATFHDAT